LKELYLARVKLLHPDRRKAYDDVLVSALVEQEELARQILAAHAAEQTQQHPADTQTRVAPESEAERVAEQGESFGNYVLLAPVSVGPHGHVYKARRKDDAAVVSLKVVPRSLAKSAEFMQRLRREFEITQRMNHPHVVAGYELGEEQGHPFLAFEFVGGTDLERLIAKQGPLSVATTVEVVRQVAEGLAYLHEHGVVHRNLKPQSILMNVQGTVKIANLTKAVEDDARALRAGRENNLTMMGQTIGSLHYLPPEQAVDSHKVDGRADLYALGCTLHTLLLGYPPFHGRDVIETLKAHRAGPIPSLRKVRRDVPRWLDQLFRQLLAKKPEDRPASAAAVVQLLDHMERPIPWKRYALIAACLIVAVVLLVGVVLGIVLPIGQSG
jgi:serine/threonine-protein kinase